jgi:hypothetical protein
VLAEETSVSEAAIKFAPGIAGGVRVIPEYLAGTDALGTADKIRTRHCAIGAIRGDEIRLLP